jgi:predicted DNA-binding transcriptional regulator AlpA
MIGEQKMPYQRVNRPPNAIPDSLAWKTLGLSRATFFRKLKEGALTAPILRSGTARRWWTPSDIEIARQELTASQHEMQQT